MKGWKHTHQPLKWGECTGDAHRNPLIDHCMICMPFWGFYPTCPKCKNKVREGKTGHNFMCDQCNLIFPAVVFPSFGDAFYKQFDDPDRAYWNLPGLYKSFLHKRQEPEAEIDHIEYARRLAYSDTIPVPLPSKKELLKGWSPK